MDIGFSPLNLCGDRNNPGLPARMPNNVMLMKPADGPPVSRTASPQYDSSVAHPARVYACWLGGYFL
jgi:hypothetical protein